MLGRVAALAFAVLFVAGCNPAAKLRDPAADAQIRAAFDETRAGDLRVISRLTPEAAAVTTPQMLAQTSAAIPPGAPKKRAMTFTNISAAPGGAAALNAVDEYDFGDRVTRVETRLERTAKDQPWRIAAFHINTATRTEIAQVNGFLAPGKTAVHWAFLAATIAAPLLMIAALVKVIRTRGLRRKWLWGILAFAGAGTATINWTTGDVAFNPLSIQFIGVGAFRDLSGFMPWTLNFTTPIGALLILAGLLANPARARKKKAGGEGGSDAPYDADHGHGHDGGSGGDGGGGGGD